MNTKSLPGIDALFREQTRLSKKLSSEELRSVRRYIEQKVEEEHDSLLFKLRHLGSAQELNEREYERSLSDLQQELDKEKWIAQEFQREFVQLTRVLKQRDERFRLKSETLISDLKKARKAMSSLEQVEDRLNKQIQQKEDIIKDLETKNNHLRDSHRSKCTALKQKHDEDKRDLRNEILKLKCSVEEKSKEIGKLRADFHEKKTEKNVTFKEVYCDASSCRARADLDDCRLQMVLKCKEIATLNYQIQQGKQKIREQTKLLGYLSPVLRQTDVEARVPKFTAARARRLAAFSLSSKK